MDLASGSPEQQMDAIAYRGYVEDSLSSNTETPTQMIFITKKM